jgi:hypothetical protein
MCPQERGAGWGRSEDDSSRKEKEVEAQIAKVRADSLRMKHRKTGAEGGVLRPKNKK